jgi:hypothetical protein
VTGLPNAGEPGVAVATVEVAASETVTGAVPEDPVKFRSPAYAAVTVSAPAGASAALHEPAPEERVTVQSAAPPAVRATVPVGVPVEPEVESPTVTE